MISFECARRAYFHAKTLIVCDWPMTCSATYEMDQNLCPFAPFFHHFYGVAHRTCESWGVRTEGVRVCMYLFALPRRLIKINDIPAMLRLLLFDAARATSRHIESRQIGIPFLWARTHTQPLWVYLQRWQYTAATREGVKSQTFPPFPHFSVSQFNYALLLSFVRSLVASSMVGWLLFFLPSPSLSSFMVDMTTFGALDAHELIRFG